MRLNPGIIRQIVAHEGAKHVDVAMCEIDEPEHSVHHRVAECDESVGAAFGNAVEELLQECFHPVSAVLLARQAQAGSDCSARAKEFRATAESSIESGIDRFGELEFAVLNFQDDRRLDGIPVAIKRNLAGDSGEIFGLGDGIAEFGGLGSSRPANGVG